MSAIARADPLEPSGVAPVTGRRRTPTRLPAPLASAPAMPAQRKPRLVVVGDGPEMGALRALAQSIYPSTEFAGARQGQELAAYFRAADVFVLPGTGGVAVQGAMSHGLPGIVAEGDGHP